MAAESTASIPKNNPASQDYIRKSPRVPVSVVVEATGKSLTLSFARNISENGMLLEVPSENNFLEVGQTLALRFNLPFGKNPVQVQSQIVAVGQTNDFSGRPILAIGMEFIKVDAAGKAEIDAYIQKYRTAQHQQVESLKTTAEQTPKSIFEAQPVDHYLKVATALLGIKEPPAEVALRPLWEQMQKLTAVELNLVTNLNPNAIALRTGLGLFLKISLEHQMVVALVAKDPKNCQPIIDEHHRAINYESDLCIEGIQKLQSQAQLAKNDSLRQLCSTVRDRLVNALTATKNLTKPVAVTTKAATPAVSWDGPWGKIQPLAHYRSLFALYFAEKMESPIEQGEVQHFIASFKPFTQKLLRGDYKESDLDLVSDAVLLCFKMKDELSRLRTIKGRHLEHIEAIREIFRHTSKTVTTTHEPIRKLLAVPIAKKPSGAEGERRGAIEEVGARLLETYSQLSDFSNLLIPGAVALSDENLNYTRGAFKEAIKQSAAAATRYVVQRQRYFVTSTVILLLVVAVFHLKSLIVWKRPFDLGEIKPPFTTTEVYLSEGELVAHTMRTDWVKLPRVKRYEAVSKFLNTLRQEHKIKGLRVYDEKQNVLAATAYNGNNGVLALNRIPEDDAAGDGSGFGR